MVYKGNAHRFQHAVPPIFRFLVGVVRNACACENGSPVTPLDGLVAYSVVKKRKEVKTELSFRLFKESRDYKRAEGPSRDEHRHQPQHIASFNQATYSNT